MISFFHYVAPLCLALTFAASGALAQGANFDLAGPSLTVTVKRGDMTLPVAQVPGLQIGDRLTLRANLPADQSARYLLIVGFLRGATNPPPKDWFHEAETWKPKKSTLTVTVPEGAEQAVIFLAPDTGGGLSTVMSGVRGRPGVFVRAAQDLHQASLDRARLDSFITGIAKIDEATPEQLSRVSPTLASSLGIKLDAACLARPRPQQAACLTQNRENMVLQINRGATLTETLTGAPADVAYRIAATREAGAGYYSPYIGLARDLAKLFGAFRTAEYQYLPALAAGRGDETRLQLNAAPSFQNPRSVLVVPLPPINAAASRDLRPAGKGMGCLSAPNLVLPVEDAALVYATGYAQQLALRITTEDGATTDVPLAADPARGGLVSAGRADAALTGRVTRAALHGRWGFDPFDGPDFPLQNGAAANWKLDDPVVIVGREQSLALRGDGGACVERVELRDAAGATRDVAWKSTSPQELAVTLPLQGMKPGALTLRIAHFGAGQPQDLPLKAMSEASRLDGFVIHDGDTAGILSGARLDQIAYLQIGETRFAPGDLSRAKDGDRLALTAQSPVPLRPGDLSARVTMKDGRTATVRATVAPARPSADLVSRNVEMPTGKGAVVLTLPDGVVPVGGRLTFSIRQTNGVIGAEDAIEIATEHGQAASKLTVASGALQRIGRDVAVATLEPQALLGANATGALRFRLLHGNATGDWQPLAQIVRLPRIESLTCPQEGAECMLGGSGLFVIAAMADNRAFERAVNVPAGFVGASLAFPKPAGKTLYLRLHDAPDAPVELAIP